MYSWDGDTSDWYGKGKYKYGKGGAAARAESAKRAAASGPRTYGSRRGPNEKVIDPGKIVLSESKNPLIVAVDVTG